MTRARCGIAFDLDGVFWRSPNVFPFSKPTLTKVIQKRIPFVFLTNSGGLPEQEKMQTFNQRLEMELDHSRLILCHTPIKQYLQHLKDEHILVSGNREIYKVPLDYGFNNAVSAGEVISAHPDIWPFDSLHKDIALDESRRHNRNILEFDPHRVSAVCILNDAACWGAETQLMIDALIYGQKRNGNDHPLFCYTNADLSWTTDYRYPRFAQGVYAGIVMDTYKRLTGKELNAVQFGKPVKATFDYAETVLLEEARKLDFDGVEQVYMIGDNPPGDIVGGNAKGWKTILLKTGVYQPGIG